MTATTIRTLATGTAGAICAALVCLPVAAQGLVVCTHGALERSVEVVYDNPGEPVPCEVRYAKPDAVTSPWRAEREEGYCERQAVGLIQKLSDAGWSCQASGDDSPPAPVAEPEAAPSAEADSEVGPELDTAEADTVTPETDTISSETDPVTPGTDTVTPEPDAAPDVAEPEATPE